MNSFLKTKIDLNPCKSSDNTAKVGDFELSDFFSTDKAMFTRSGRDALRIVLGDILKLKKNDNVTILKSLSDFNDHYISSCVTKVIEEFCHWSHGIEDNTKVILVIHEFGYPFAMEKLEKLQGKYVIIEDCAYALGTKYQNTPVGKFSDYAIFSFPKIFPIGFGGVLLGAKQMQNDLLLVHEDFIKSTLASNSPALQEIVKKRISVWHEMKTEFENIGFSAAMPLAEEMNPGVFLLDCKNIKNVSLEKLEKIKSALQEFGIENTIYYPTLNMVLPCHQDLDKENIKYIVDTFHSVI